LARRQPCGVTRTKWASRSAPSTRRRSGAIPLARQRHAALLAAALGARVLVVHVSSLRFADPDPAVRAQARDRDLRRLEGLTAYCQPLSVSVGLENGKLPSHADYLHSLIESLGRGANEMTGLVFDSGHAALRGGDLLAVAERMLPRLIHTHLHDTHGKRDDHLPPGDGCIEWQPLLDRLSTARYTGALLLELHPRSTGSPAQWQQALSRGRKVLSTAVDRTKGGEETPI
jgi:sugar phosphate isomerase/epimerase